MMRAAASIHPARTRTAICVALALAGSVTFSSSSAGAAEPVSFEGSANPVIGTTYDWTVPAGVTVVEIEANGAQGGDIQCGPLRPGGLGGRTLAVLRVSPGEVLRVTPGGRGGTVGPGGSVGCLDSETRTPGGFNGGGAAGFMTGNIWNGAGGGGGSDVRRAPYGASDRLVTAGGGGGAASVVTFTGATEGGAGGGTTGSTGGGMRQGGGGGSQSAGGEAGLNGGGGRVGNVGVLAFGGAGADTPDGANAAGAGGGGGWFGGGGGGAGALTGGGGGGGSGNGPSGATLISGIHAGPGRVVIRTGSEQSISFTSRPPVSPTVSGTYVPTATGGGSGNPVVFSIASGPCTLASGVVTFTGVGACVVAANQAGGGTYLSAPRVTQSIIITKITPTISTQASAGGVIGTAVHDVATVAGASPTGAVTFALFSDATCTAEVFVSTTGVAGGQATSGSFTPMAAGTYYWTAVYSGDAKNNAATSPCGAPNESVIITKASPTISTQASPGGLLGTPVRDVASVAGGLAPTGAVTFRLFSDSGCTTQVFTSTKPLAGDTATSDWFTPLAAGAYRWTAVYGGDAKNNTATSACNAPNESVVITPFQAPTFTRSIAGELPGPVTVTSGESVLINGARVLGPLTVEPGGAVTIVNSRLSRGITANAPSFFSICGSDVFGSAPAAALSVTNAAVPIRVGDPAGNCASNRFAGHVVLFNNLAVIFGGNTVSHNVTVSQNGPGSTMLKANTVFGTLACAGNNPPPTNAGQVNTAGAKTGQCSAL